MKFLQTLAFLIVLLIWTFLVCFIVGLINAFDMFLECCSCGKNIIKGIWVDKPEKADNL